MIVRPFAKAPPFAALLALAGLLAIGAVRADGAGADAIEPGSHIREVAEKYVSAQVAPTATVTAQALDNRLRLPACARPLEAVAANPATRNGWNIVVSCRDDSATLWTIFVPVKVADLRPVVVVTRAVPPGTPISADMVVLENRDLGTLPSGHLASLDAVLGRSLRRPLGPGAAITPDALAATRLVRRGALVTLVGRIGSLEVRSQGKALADGGDGDRIQVENLSSKRIVQGVIRDGDTVEVSL